MMITYTKKGNRHTFAMNDNDFIVFAEVFWILKHTPPPAGFNRKDWTMHQKQCFDRVFGLINYPKDYGEMLHNITGQ